MDMDIEAADEHCRHCGTRHDTTGEGRYSDGSVCDLYGIRRPPPSPGGSELTAWLPSPEDLMPALRGMARSCDRIYGEKAIAIARIDGSDLYGADGIRIDPEDIEEGADDAWVAGGADVRLRVYSSQDPAGAPPRSEEDMAWQVLCGPSDYDQDHRGYWGASSVSSDMEEAALYAVASDLIDQVGEHMAQVI